MSDWSRRVTAEYPHLNIVGEEWNGNPVTVSYWQRGKVHADGYVSYLPSLFDFPLEEAVVQGLREKETASTGLARIYRVLASDSVYPDPFNLVVFPDNHDTSRILSQLDERTDLDRMAIAFFLTIRGIPQLYYGTEVLMSSPGPRDDGIIRSDFPGGWLGDTKNAFTGQGLSGDERAMQEYTRKLLQWRRTAPAIRDGKLTQYVPTNGVYVYFRHDAAQKVMVVLNNGDDAQTLDTKRFHEVIGAATTGTDVLSQQTYELAKGVAVPARSATILELK
jgi:glycosidase